MTRKLFTAAVACLLVPAVAPATAGAAVKVRGSVVYGKGRVNAPAPGSAKLLLDLYEPARKSKARRPVVVLIHGGGFRQGHRTDAGIVRVAKGLAARGIVAASIDYRLSGQEPVASRRVKPLADAAPKSAPVTGAVVAVDDTLTAIDYLKANARKLNIDVGRLGVVGSSAGAVTADHVAYVLDDYGIRAPKVKLAGSLWGGIIQPNAPGREGRNTEMLERGEAALFAHHGDADPTVPVALDDALVARAKDQKVRNEYHRIAGGAHGYPGSRFFTEKVSGSRTSFDRFLLFAKSTLRETSASAAGAAPTHEDAVRAGRDAYLYGFPLIDFLRIRRENTSVKAPDKIGNAPVNFFSHAPRFATPDDRTVVAPNVDTLYSIAQVDLGKGPIVLSHPNMGKRYFVFEFVEPFTNVVGYVGTRTTGTKAGRFALSWTGRKNAKPPRGVRTVRSPYRRLWVIGRTLTTGTKADLARARKLQRRYGLTPLARLNNPPRAPSGRPGDPVKATNPTGLAFFNALGVALEQNPPPARDKPLLDRLARFGIGPGLRPDRAGLSQEVLDGLVEGYDAQSTELSATTRLQILQQARASGGWYTPPSSIGDFGTDYLFRAQIALVGIGANTPEEAVYPGALADRDGNLLDATKRYRVTFAKGQAPPNDAFWSLTMYDLEGYLTDNPIDRYAIGDFHPPLVKRSDGSIVVAIQRERPVDSDVNWLPTPASGNFRLNLRIYAPRRSVLTGAWKPPPVEPVP